MTWEGPDLYVGVGGGVLKAGVSCHPAWQVVVLHMYDVTDYYGQTE